MNKWEIDVELVEDWIMSLVSDSLAQLAAALDHLRIAGPHVGRPLVDTVKGSRFHNMKELRPGSTERTEMRVLFIFDPQRKAILLVGGDKSGKWSTWYRKSIHIAEFRYAQYLERNGMS